MELNQYTRDALYFFNEGKNEKAYEVLGAHALEEGYVFRVWAPRAKSVSVIGDFNAWNPENHRMKLLEHQGVWELFVAEAKEGQAYKYLVEDFHQQKVEKADPFARASEKRPATASLLTKKKDFVWTDEAYCKARPCARENNYPLNIYEVHLASWKKHWNGDFYNYRELAHELGDYLLEMGYTHIELLPVMEHPLDASWGYQVTGFFSVTSRFGTIEDFKYFVNHLHNLGIGVILDWVPAHFPKDQFALANFDGTPTFEYEDSYLGEHPEWGTKIFDYGKNQVRSFLMSSAFYWVEEFHIDGLRFDAVSTILYRNYAQASFSPNRYGGRENLEGIEFLKETCARLAFHHPWLLLMAEESSTFPALTKKVEDGGIGFNYKWDMGWMHDTLDYFSKDYVYRRWHHNMLTFSMSYGFSERFVMSLSHDEVVHGKKSLIGRMPGDHWKQFASLRLLFSYMIGHPGAKLTFMGSEFGQFIEWKFYEELEWFLLGYETHKQLQDYVKTLNHLYKSTPALYQVDTNWQGFQWRDANNEERSVYAFVREDEQGNQAYFVLNMTPNPVENYVLSVHQEGYHKLLLNSDDGKYGGSSYPVVLREWGHKFKFYKEKNELQLLAEKKEGASHAEIVLNLPPLSCLILNFKQKNKKTVQKNK